MAIIENWSSDQWDILPSRRKLWSQFRLAGALDLLKQLIRQCSTTWAAKDLPARLLAAQVAKLLNCTTDDVAILVSAGKLRALGKPKQNAVKYFSSIELITLLTDRDWLDEATKTIGQFWRRKNARRNGLATESQTNPSELLAG